MSKHFFPMSDLPTCPHCAQPQGVQLEVNATGYSCRTTFQHLPTCLLLRCPHGVLWREDCAACDAEYDAAHVGEDDEDDYD